MGWRDDLFMAIRSNIDDDSREGVFVDYPTIATDLLAMHPDDRIAMARDLLEGTGMVVARDDEEFARRERALWQPIETAPRDGTVIDLWFAGDAWNCRMPGFIWRAGMGFWHNENTHQSYNDGPGITHWRPLPEGPGG